MSQAERGGAERALGQATEGWPALSVSGDGLTTTTETGSGLTARALLLATGLAILSGLWMKAAGLIGHAVQLGESVPAIPAVAALVLFLVLNPLLARLHPKLAFRRAEVLVVFVILSVTPLINSVGMMRMLLPMMIAPPYFATPENHLDLVWDRLPRWFGPRDLDVIRDAFEGHQPGVPWDAWLPGLTVWFCFSLAMYLALLGLGAIFRRQWSERERLTFPLMQVVEELTADTRPHLALILRNPIFWVGASIPLLYNLLQMTHAFFPTFPELGRGWDLGKGLEARPWNALRPMNLAYRPELVGLGYLMSTEVTLTIWVTYLGLRFSRLLVVLLGYAEPSAPIPYDQSQAMGCYVALALVALYLGRGAIREALGKAWSPRARGDIDDSGEPLSYRGAVLCLLGGLGFVLFVSLRAGMGWGLALLYFFLVFAAALVYSRVRAETGAPMVWLFPFWQQEKLIYSLFGSSPFLVAGDAQPLVILASFTWLSRGYFPNSVMASQLEGFKLAGDGGTTRRQMAFVLLYAFVLGFAVAVWVHLTTYYDMGAAYAEGGGRAKLQNQGYLSVAQILTGQARRPHLGESTAALAGFGIALGMVAARIRILGFPFHPLGYAMATAYGHPLWGSALLVWAVKSFILRVGGIKLFRKFIPGFIGLVIGHFFASGVIWGLVAIWNPSVTYNYVVYFG